MSRRRAIVLSYYPPDPRGDSGSKRIVEHMGWLQAAGWTVDFFATNGIPDAHAAGAVRRMGIGVYAPETAPLESLLEAGQHDLALFAFWQTAEHHMPLVRDLSPDTRVLVDSIDLQLLRDARRAFEEGRDLAGPRLLGEEFGSEMVGELNVYAASDGVLTVSTKEADLINDLLGAATVTVPVPDAEAKLKPMPLASRRGIVFVGSFSHAPNAGAVEYLCKDVVPRLDERLLASHPVLVVGSGLDETILEYGRGLEDRVQMVGWVPSVLPYIAQARVSVVPLQYGAGTKRKLLQSLMAGTPAVSTTIGVEGIDITDGEDVLVADDPETFATAVSRLLEDDATWLTIASSGKLKVEATHAEGVVRRKFLKAVRDVVGRSPKSQLLPEPSEKRYNRRMTYLQNQKIVPAVRLTLDRLAPAGDSVDVVSDGSSELLRLGRHAARHFPCDEYGYYRGNPASSQEAIELLEQARSAGTGYFFIPGTSRWWLHHYKEFTDYLATSCGVLLDDETLGVVYALKEQALPKIPEVDEQAPPLIIDKEPEPASAPLELPGGLRLLAFYLPQFHPIPENDEWWGEGFTEWTNVAKAQPLFDGHYQPHVPADLGFYDLRLPEARQAQAQLAREYGIGGFCYYHYWFGGTRLLGRPFDEMLASGEPDFPFCLCWANEPWSRRWHGRDEDVLQPQTYSAKDDREHIHWLLPALADPRAVAIDGRPVFIVYQARDLPEPARTVETWRRESAKAGLPDPYLMTVETGWDEAWDATAVGFDAKVMFRPQFTTLREAPRVRIDGEDELEVRDYQAAWPLFARPEVVDYPHFETVCPQWDNSPRTGSRAVVLHNSTPEAYENWLLEVLKRTVERPQAERLVFINAWNEWGEGCHLEPDVRSGHGYLEATRRALERVAASGEGGRPAHLRLLKAASARGRR
jgi:glycosyltransferase involved in cell wall biosynthesis